MLFNTFISIVLFVQYCIQFWTVNIAARFTV